MSEPTIYPWRYQINRSSFAHYWQKGIGVELLKKIGSVPDIKNAEHFVPYLFDYDKEADNIIEQIHKKIGFTEGQKLIDKYFERSLDTKDPSYNLLDKFIRTMKSMAAKFDMEQIQHGILLSQRSAISGLIVLRDYCLMGGYESAAINKPLIYTGALKKGAVKRISETVEFWVNITGNDALKYGNIGFISIVKIRLIHAFARTNILAHTDWDINKWGYPLNTWDMLATNLGFSLVYIVGLQRMGMKLLNEEILGILKLWKYVGNLLGIPLTILPNTEEEAIEALYYWTMTQANGDEDSLSLAYALQEEPLIAYHPKSKIGKKMMREIHLYYNHFLLGDYSCDLLGLDTTITGKIAYMNILKNKYDSKHIQKKKHYDKLVAEGRKLHELIRNIYLQNIKGNAKY